MLASIPTEALAEVAARAREIHCEPGEVIYREGEPNRGSFLLVEGALQLRKGRALVRVIHPGMGSGELWLGEGQPYNYTLVAIDHSHVLNVTREDNIDAMLDYPEFGVALAQSFAKTLHDLTGRVLDLENLVSRLHARLLEAGIEPPDPRIPDVGGDSEPQGPPASADARTAPPR